MTSPNVLRLPAQIRVGAKTFAVRRDKTLDGRGNWGETDHTNREIRFAASSDPVEVALSLIHELLHCCWFQYGLKDLKDENEERIVNSLGDGLTQVLQDLGYLPLALKTAEEE